MNHQQRWQKHRKCWLGCVRCPLHEQRKQVVLAKGKIPCDVLFVGEAPGESENVIGLPFEGPAGKVLVEDTVEPVVGDKHRVAYTNLVACIPYGEDGNKVGEPLPEDIMKCAPRLRDFVELARPKLIVCVGDLAANYLMPERCTPKAPSLLPKFTGLWAHLTHPAAILRANLAQQGFMQQRNMVKLATAIHAMENL